MLYAREQAEALDLPPAYCQDSARARVELPRLVSDSLQSTRSGQREAARRIGERLGRNLGHIVLALHRGDEANRLARPDWSPDEWDRWSGIRQIWLGGGMMSGKLGAHIVQQAQAFLAEYGGSDCPQLGLSPHKSAIALLGAARYLPNAVGHHICLDLGQTLIKRARVTLTAGTITQVRHHQPLAADWDNLGELGKPNAVRGRRVLDIVASAIVQTIDDVRKEGLRLGEEIMLSVAAYVRDGQLLGNGVYAQLTFLDADTEVLVADAVEARTGISARVHFIHDGTAAAAMHAGETDTAVIVVGTALGIGFPPASASGLRRLA